ncbi:unnamed protein product [Nippostrongylus brasiliensis]|uniref:Endo/exonuclease/phosphatase domain-containing protein n=1 Tax=Nippostrongylus brasiliensis TaxID=27835 RepID=A0A0N4XL25_NIPBR|nr:unnamed protein product [Nippostrongylus brasiliensis]
MRQTNMRNSMVEILTMNGNRLPCWAPLALLLQQCCSNYNIKGHAVHGSPFITAVMLQQQSHSSSHRIALLGRSCRPWRRLPPRAWALRVLWSRERVGGLADLILLDIPAPASSWYTSTSETKRKDPLSCTWSDGTAVFLGSRKAQSTSGGVGFIVAPGFAKYITSVTFHSHRLGVLTATTSKGMVSIIQAYAPTADSSEELHEEFYEELQDLIRSQKSNCIIVGGDFNARIGPRRPGERFIGPNSAEIRNDTGEMLANFCETLHLYHGNSHFFKPPNRRWTHCSPNGQHLHELDHIMCNRKVFTDVGVVPSFNTGSDHRLLRARLHFDRMQVRLTQIRQKQTRIKRIDIEALQSMMDSVSFDMFGDIDEDYSRIRNIITTLATNLRCHTKPTRETEEHGPAEKPRRVHCAEQAV